MKLEVQIMLGLLEHGMQYLSPIPGEAEAALAGLVAYDVRTLVNKGLPNEESVCRLVWLYLQRGRSFERGNHICEGSFGRREDTYV